VSFDSAKSKEQRMHDWMIFIGEMGSFALSGALAYMLLCHFGIIFLFVSSRNVITVEI
jgi:hypothetical protein